MPESRTRKSATEKQKLKAQQAAKPKKIKPPSSRRWVPPTFIAVGLLGVVTGLGLDEADQIRISSRPQVRTLGVCGADHNHHSSRGTHGRRDRTRHPASVAIAPSLGITCPTQDGDDRAPGIGSSTSRQVLLPPRLNGLFEHPARRASVRCAPGWSL